MTPILHPTGATATTWETAIGLQLTFLDDCQTWAAKLREDQADQHLDIVVTYLGAVHIFTIQDFLSRLGFDTSLGKPNAPASQ